ncbi:MAG: hypothetical protein P1P64_04310 [Treponemataceae bacterium]
MIYLITDISASMSVLGKSAIVGNLKTTLYTLKEIDDKFSTVQFEECEWNGTNEELKNIFASKNIEKAFVFTDGYFSDETENFILETNKDSKNIVVVFCGSDSKVKNKIGIEPKDICYSFEKLVGLRDVQKA